MSYSTKLGTTMNETRLRTPMNQCDLSGMCSVCTEECTGLCEIGLSAIRGAEATYPYGTTTQQFASEKRYPLDYSCFNSNGRVFGAMGAVEDPEKTNVHSANIEVTLGKENPISCTAPIILPAIAKLNWKDYYAGAAMYGVPVVIGECAVRGDAKVDEQGKVLESKRLQAMVKEYRTYQHGLGDIILQVDADDMVHEVAEYGIKECGVTSIEIKFGQAAKGIQHMAYLYSLEEAQQLKRTGYLVEPDPFAKENIEAFHEGERTYFLQFGRIPMWTEKELSEAIEKYRALGAKNIFFKMAGYDARDVKQVLKLASDHKVTMVTYDGAGGGTGHSPCKMMNEWGIPTVELEAMICRSVKELQECNRWVPQIALAGGFTSEDQIFKALAFGEQKISMIAVGRGAMAAAMAAKNVGTQIGQGMTPAQYKRFGEDINTIFRDARRLKKQFGDEISTGAIGVYSYLDRLGVGLRQFMTLNRKFALEYLSREDVIPLTPEARRVVQWDL